MDIVQYSILFVLSILIPMVCYGFSNLIENETARARYEFVMIALEIIILFVWMGVGLKIYFNM